jgi:hypothetical protein
MKSLIALAALLAASAQAAPGDYHLIIHGASYHTVPRTSGPQWNQVNPGIGGRYEESEATSFQAGVYKNSFYKNSFYVGADWAPLDLKIPDIGEIPMGRAQFGLFAGLASGYVGKVGIAAGGLARWQGKDFSLAMRIVPAKCSIFALELGYRF